MIENVRLSFQEAIGTKGRCIAARLAYEEGGKVQRLEFDIADHPTLIARIPEGSNPVDYARTIGEAWTP